MAKTFRVVEQVPVVTYIERVLLETDDWLEAEAEATRYRVVSADQQLPQVKGTHPSHDFTRGEACAHDGCGAHDNGSYGSHAPCGTEFRISLHQMIEDWRSARAARESQ
jgi:hypothetical protein